MDGREVAAAQGQASAVGQALLAVSDLCKWRDAARKPTKSHRQECLCYKARREMIRQNLKRMSLAAGALMLLAATAAFAQDSPTAPLQKKAIAIRGGKLIDGKRDAAVPNALILIEDGKIVSVTP